MDNQLIADVTSTGIGMYLRSHISHEFLACWGGGESITKYRNKPRRVTVELSSLWGMRVRAENPNDTPCETLKVKESVGQSLHCPDTSQDMKERIKEVSL